jgi:SAM-dependent methyltransferase
MKIKLTDNEKLTIAAYEKAPDAWAAYFDSGGGWPEELKQFKKFLPSGRVLEVGAGSGRDAKELIKLGYDYVGTDVSEKLLDLARSNCTGAKFIKMSLYGLSFPDKFDGFWASAVLLHVPKSRMHEALEKIKNNMNKGAIGFISIKDGDGEIVLEKEIDGLETKRFFSLWRKDEFENVLRDHDFKTLYYGHRLVTANTKWHMYIVRLN